MSHSRLAPSKSHVWVPCVAAVPFTEANEGRLPPDVESEFAAEGTRAHAAITALLRDAQATPKMDNDEMAGCVGDFLELVKGQREDGDTLYVTRKVALFYYPKDKGELDVALISKDRKRIIVDDYKHGQGVGVYSKDNPQLLIYAESLVAEMEIVEEVPDDALIVLIIHQPRDRNDPEPTRLWAISRRELAKHCEPITVSAAAILAAPAIRPLDKTANEDSEHARILKDLEAAGLTFKAGDHCDKGFCRARGICPKYAARGLEVLPDESRAMLTNVDAPAVELPSPASLTREQRVRVIQSRKILEKWLEAVEDQEVAELLSGAPRLGLKLVEGKSNRQWADEAAAEKLLANYLDTETRRKPWEVISIAQSEKALKKVEKAGTKISTKFWGKFSALQVKPKGNASLVSEDDPRPALALSPSEGMTDLTGSDCI